MPPDFDTAYAVTGESASIASALPVATAAVAVSCPAYFWIFIGFDPHFFCRAGRSSWSWTVLAWTAMFLPHGLSGSTPAGLPAAVAHWVPAEK